jgi:hypothetical protein
MSRAGLFGALAFLGLAAAFTAIGAAPRSATPMDMLGADQSGAVPLDWVQQALSDMPFLTPGRN